jgi:hypothetical protein
MSLNLILDAKCEHIQKILSRKSLHTKWTDTDRTRNFISMYVCYCKKNEQKTFITTENERLTREPKLLPEK